MVKYRFLWIIVTVGHKYKYFMDFFWLDNFFMIFLEGGHIDVGFFFLSFVQITEG